jgi:hypothetical protein
LELRRAVDDASPIANLSAFLFEDDFPFRYLSLQHLAHTQSDVSEDAIRLVIQLTAYRDDLSPDDGSRSDDQVVVWRYDEG